MMLLRRFLAVHESEASFQKRGFVAHDAERAAMLEKTGRSFLEGYHSAVSFSRTSILTESLEKMPDELYKGFRYEGAAMACCILDGLPFSKAWRLRSLMESPRGQQHIYMLHVGAGWAFARLPGSVEKKILKLDPVYRWLALDGYGFHQAYFKTRKYVEERKFPKELREPYSAKAFYQGVGRCLWFVDCATAEKVAERINGFDLKYQEDLWAGVGLACAYAGGTDEQGLLHLKDSSRYHWPHLLQGVVFAAKARERAGIITADTRLACRVLCGLRVDEASAITDKFFAVIPDRGSSAAKYEWWRTAIRNSFLKNQQHEQVSEKVFS